MVVGLKESLEGPSCQSCPLPTPSIYHIPPLSAWSIRGLPALLEGGGPVSSTQQERHPTKLEVAKLPLAPEGRKVLSSGGMTHGDR